MSLVSTHVVPLQRSAAPGSAHKRRARRVEFPLRNQKLHGNRVIPRTQTHAFVTAMRGIDLRHVYLDAETWPLRDLNRTLDDLERVFGQPLAVLPDPVRVNCSDLAGRGCSDVSKHRKRDVEMIVRM